MIELFDLITYTVLFVTAIRARAKSSGYVIVDDVTPANDPAINRRPGVFLLKNQIKFRLKVSSTKFTRIYQY